TATPESYTLSLHDALAISHTHTNTHTHTERVKLSARKKALIIRQDMEGWHTSFQWGVGLSQHTRSPPHTHTHTHTHFLYMHVLYMLVLSTNPFPVTTSLSSHILPFPSFSLSLSLSRHHLLSILSLSLSRHHLLPIFSISFPFSPPFSPSTDRFRVNSGHRIPLILIMWLKIAPTRCLQDRPHQAYGRGSSWRPRPCPA